MIIDERTFGIIIQNDIETTIRPIGNYIFVTLRKGYCEVSICLYMSTLDMDNQKILSDLVDRFIMCYEKYGYWKED